MLKKSLIILFSLLVIAVSVPLLYLYSMDEAELKRSVSDMLSAKTNETIRINGNLHWQILPTIGLNVDDIDIEPTKKSNLIQGHIRQINLKLSLWALVHKKLQFNSINLSKAILKTNLNQPKSRIKQSAPNQQPRQNKMPLQINFNDIRIQDSQLTIKQGNKQIALNDFNLNLHEQKDSHKLKLNTQVDMIVNHNYIKANSISITGTLLGLNEALNHSDMFKFLQMQADFSAKTILVNRLEITGISSQLSIDKGDISVKDANAQLAGGQANANISYHIYRDELTTQESLKHVNPRTLLKAANRDISIADGHLSLSFKSKTHRPASEFINNTQALGHISFDKTLIDVLQAYGVIQSLVNDIPKLASSSPTGLENQFKTGLVNEKGNRQTDMQGKGRFEADFQMANSIIQPLTFSVDYPQIKVNGSLKINLSNQLIAGQMNIITKTGNKDINKVQALLNGSFPFVITGRVDDMKTYPDVARIAPVLVEQLVKDKSKKAIRDWGKQLFSKAISNLND